MVIASLNLYCLMQRKQELSLHCSPAPPRTKILVHRSPLNPGGQCSWKEAALAPVPAVGILTCPRGTAEQPLGARPSSGSVPAFAAGAGVCRGCSWESCRSQPRSCNHHGNVPRTPAGKSRKRTVADLSYLMFHLPFLLHPHEPLKHGAVGGINHKGKLSLWQRQRFHVRLWMGSSNLMRALGQWPK